MVHLPASAIVFKRLIVSLAITISSFPITANGHEVIASTVTVSRDRGQIEILQTSPINALQTLITPSEEYKKEPAWSYENLLKTLSKQWIASAGDEACRLSRRAYRPLKSGHEAQFRFLFVCKEATENISLSATWVEKMPPSHFILLDRASKGQPLQTIIEARPANILVPTE